MQECSVKEILSMENRSAFDAKSYLKLPKSGHFNPIALRKSERPKLYTILAFLSAVG